MVVELGGGDAAASGQLAGVSGTATGFQITGDPTAAHIKYVHSKPNVVTVSNSLADLVQHLEARGEDVTVSAESVSHLLHHGLVPFPNSIYDGIWALGMGDVATATRTTNGFELALSHDYPWIEAKSSGNSIPDTDRLLALLAASTERCLVNSPGPATLMLSSGVDSTSIALALAELGRTDVECFTYRSGINDTEAANAAAVCRKLGLPHHTVDLPVAGPALRDSTIKLFARASAPCADLVALPYAYTIQTMARNTGVVLDGGGNDAYIGFVPEDSYWHKQRFRIRWRTISDLVNRLVPPDSPLAYFARSRAEASIPSRTLRFRDTAKFFDGSTNTHEQWWNESRRLSHLDAFDLDNAVGTRHYDPNASALKLWMAAEACGMKGEMPYCDEALAEYCFNLPKRERYDLRRGREKILLNRLLTERLDYDGRAVGHHGFTFDGAPFLATNRDFVVDEIGSCAVWNSKAGDLATRWLDALPRRPKLYHALLTLFQVSGWLNRSKYARPIGDQSTEP